MENDRLVNVVLKAIHDDLQVMTMVIAKEEIDVMKELNRVNYGLKEVTDES